MITLFLILPVHSLAQPLFPFGGAQCGAYASGGCHPYLRPCPDSSDAEILIRIQTDSQANDTQWVLSDQADSSIVAFAGPLVADSSYTFRVCAYLDHCYAFVITDASGNGISAPGGYSLILNGEEKVSGGVFGMADTALIGAACCTDLTLELSSQSALYGSGGSVSLSSSGGTPPFSYQWSTGAHHTTSIGNLGPGVYSVTLTDAGGCSLTDSIEVVSVSCGKDIFEPNDEQALSANLFGGALAGVVNDTRLCPPGDEDWYFLQAADPIQKLDVRLEGLPANFNLELYDAAGLLAASANGGNANERIEIPQLAKDTYYLRVYGQERAWSELPYTLIVNLSLPVPPGTNTVKPPPINPVFKEMPAEEWMNMYPNPVSDVLYLSFYLPDPADGLLSISGIRGEEISKASFSAEAGQNIRELDVSDLSPGIYLVTLETGEESRSQRVIISR